jgi:hypothetical protein
LAVIVIDAVFGFPQTRWVISARSSTRGFLNYYQLLNEISLPEDYFGFIVGITDNSGGGTNAVCWVSSFKISYV